MTRWTRSSFPRLSDEREQEVLDAIRRYCKHYWLPLHAPAKPSYPPPELAPRQLLVICRHCGQVESR